MSSHPSHNVQARHQVSNFSQKSKISPVRHFSAEREEHENEDLRLKPEKQHRELQFSNQSSKMEEQDGEESAEEYEIVLVEQSAQKQSAGKRSNKR